MTTAPSGKPFDPQQTYVHLGASGAATQVAGGDAFWLLPQGEMEQFGEGWLVAEFAFDTDWPTWEMHPQGDEFVYLLSGAIDLHLEEPGGLRTIALDGSGAVVVPQGIWHTAKVRRSARMLHVTRGAGTQTRPVTPQKG